MAVCMFTGHRPKGLPFGYNEKDCRCKKLKKMLKKLIVQKIQEENTSAFLSGMALGTDMFAAEIILELKRKFRDITLTAVPLAAHKPQDGIRNQLQDMSTFWLSVTRSLFCKRSTPQVVCTNVTYISLNILIVL